MLVNNIRLRVFSREDESLDEIVAGLKSLFPFDLEKEKIAVEKKNAEGFNEKKIVVVGLILEKQRLITDFLESLNEKLSGEQIELLLRQADSRLDQELCFFMRVDKEKLLKEQRIWITDEGNCYHISISIAAFPRKREVALEVVQKIFHKKL